MSKEIYISSTPHETRLAIVESDELTEIYYERENEYTLAGSIYNGKVTRVLPGMQSSFVDIGLERDAFLYITDFMEEAADTAEFDHSGDGPRPTRSEGQRSESRGDQGRNGHERETSRNGNDRGEGYVSERSREQMNASPSTDVARASEGRDEEFGGRGDRGRGRSRRDRGRGGERTGLPERNTRTEGAPRLAQAQVVNEPKQDGFTQDERQPAVEALPGGDADAFAPANGAELGEGAPGADGSRRWRGRRGRRRGRGTGQQEGVAGSLAPESLGGTELPESSRLDVSPVVDETAEEVSAFQTDGDQYAQTSSIAHTVTPLETRAPIRSAEPADQERGRERSGRNDRVDRGGRGDRVDRNQRSPRVPRGFAPTRSLYGVDSNEPEDVPYGQPVDAISASGAEHEPVILPGESLSKYRKGGDEAAPSTTTATASGTQGVPEDSGFKIDPNWDGGAMLPGETLSRYRGGAPQVSGSQERSDGRGDPRRDGRRDGGRDRQNDRSRDGRRNDRQTLSPPSPRQNFEMSRERPLAPKEDTASAMMVPSSVPATDLQSRGPVSGYSHVSQESEEIHSQQSDFSHTELPEAMAEAPTMEDRGLAHQAGEATHGSIEQIDAAQPAAPFKEETPDPEQDYEPEGQSVSYRVDPSAPSEYRQASPSIVDDEPEAAQEVEQHLEVAPSGEVYAVDLQADSIPQPGELDDLSAESAVADEAGRDPSSSFGSSMLTDLPGQAGGKGEQVSHSSATSDESAFTHDVTTLHAEGEMTSNWPSEDLVEEEAGAQSFAPGAGDLEEDFIEEDEVETTSLHARGEEELDDLEEEHLEGTADLGMIIREMSLDQITRTDGSLTEEEEDDFEEDTLEEDTEAQGSDSFESFSAPEDGEEHGEIAEEERAGFTAEPVEGASSVIGTERRGRRDSGRRGGRERSGNRESGNRTSRSDRPFGSEGSGYGDRSVASDRDGYSDRSGVGERARNTGGSSDRDRGRSSGRGGRQSMQMTNLPAISDLLKPGQEILCQIAKEPIAKKGARITSHIALPGRFLVFMPTVSHTGVSRKIESDGERRRLKEILLSEKGEAAGGFIVRTAAAGATEEELRSDLRFLLNLWADIKQRSESSKSPALIYHDLNLVERILRDQVTDNFSAIWVDTETEYERVLRFLQRFQPGLIRRVKLYTKETPLFEQFGITEEINKALRSKVWLKSGGSIVINQTEALVAIDINTGKYVGKTARLEDTIVKTNLDAIPEIVRQIRLRDLGGIIIIDFIDMDERKNRNRVMAALEEELKMDRAPSKILPFNDFGLVAITRKRVKQSLERTLSTTCGVCTGTGMVKSPVTVCNDIYVEMRKMHKHLDRGDVMLRVNPEVVKQLKSTGTRWLQEMEEMCGKTILIKSDPSLHPEQFDIH